MSNFLESEILGKFIERLKSDTALPSDLVDSISKLKTESKISKSTNLKKVVEEYTPKEEVINEDKKN